jgi:hypothetical protein
MHTSIGYQRSETINVRMSEQAPSSCECCPIIQFQSRELELIEAVVDWVDVIIRWWR